MDTGILINQLIQLFLVICMGYLLFKVKIFNIEVNQKLTKLLLNVTLPAMILSSVLKQTERPPSNEVMMVFAVAIAMYVLLPLISFLLVKIIRIPKADQGVYMFMHTFSNVGFMGFPIISAIYGETAVFYAAIINIIFNISVFTYGIVMIHYPMKNGAKIDIKKLLSPGVLCSLAAVVFYIFDIGLPVAVENAVDTLGSVTTPLAMLLIGSTLATMNVKSVFDDWRVYVFSVIKQLVIPVALWFVIRMVIPSEYILGITFIMILMPVANTALLFATEYGHGEQLAAKTVFITTMMSLITIPLGIYICMG